jgi:hypothetical protein
MEGLFLLALIVTVDVYDTHILLMAKLLVEVINNDSCHDCFAGAWYPRAEQDLAGHSHLVCVLDGAQQPLAGVWFAPS